MRIGNGAYDQRQNDVWGALLDSIYLHEKALRGTGTPADRQLIRYQVEAAIAAWPHPDQGIWESRGEPQHYVSSKLMIWVAVDRGARLARGLGFEEVAEEWERTADEIPRGDPRARRARRRLPPALRDRRARRLHPADPPAALPAPPTTRGCKATVEAIADRADRARPRPALQGRGDRRRPQRRGGHLPDLLLLARLGALGDRRAARARALCERLLEAAGWLDLYAEELDAPSGRHLGNFPQAFTHLALINAVSHVIADEQREDGGPTAVFTEMGGVREDA